LDNKLFVIALFYDSGLRLIYRVSNDVFACYRD